ncbi:MAG: class I SAM-dependent methyltransferase [Nitriliruptorales bacterium]|nr:class I SAM-dependent methyltransferase [Nitriliruptorales bacterium]
MPSNVASPADAREPAPAALLLTGERTLPGIADERYWFERHVVAYDLAREHVGPGSVVLDAGCGEGYGLPMLADAGASRVIGVDLDGQVIAHVAATYASGDKRIEAVAAELMDMPLADGEVDLAVSFQVIEHLHDIPGYLHSLRRVTRAGGHVLIATPNRLTFTPGSDTPVNPFHTREFTADELRAELEAAGLDVVTVLGIFHGDVLRQADEALGRSLMHVLGAGPPETWPDWVRQLVHRTTAAWFEVGTDDLDAALDLVAVATVPDEPR